MARGGITMCPAPNPLNAADGLPRPTAGAGGRLTAIGRNGFRAGSARHRPVPLQSGGVSARVTRAGMRQLCSRATGRVY